MKLTLMQETLLALSFVGSFTNAGCPFLEQQEGGALKLEQNTRSLRDRRGDGGVPEGGFEAVKADLRQLMTNSQDFWPADFSPPVGPHYGGLFIRLAWHCSGSYRESDGRGGCDGGRIRFDPELNWDDNANLNMALKLLKPIKENYGESLSWGDLVILSGNTAIESMGGPTLGFCGGRIDDANGDNSLKLGPSDEQEEIAPCTTLNPSKQGECLSVAGTALGPTTVGLIYVNPGGPKGAEGDPVASGEDIRTAFGRMGFNDVESVSLIGGGHAFGKCHGACPEGASQACGTGDQAGIGVNTFTSGFEGAWTTTPTTWSNQYFQNLFNYNWTAGTGAGGNLQFAPSNADGSAGPDIIMLTSDVALAEDEAYKPISEKYAQDLEALEADFAASWYRLTSADMGPASRCIGDEVAAPQPFQATLLDAPETLPDYIPIRAKIQSMLDDDSANSAVFINLAYRCASTFRTTDYRGGCNGARIRFSPEADWPQNTGTAEALAKLTPVKEDHPEISNADLIALAGQTALEDSNSGLSMPFCGGRVDARDASHSASLAPREYPDQVVSVRDDFQVKGLTPEEGVALAARENLSNQYFANLLAAGSDSEDYSAGELALLEAEFLPIVESFAADEEELLSAFASGWTYMLTADRYANNAESACTGVDTPSLSVEGSSSTSVEGSSNTPAEGSSNTPAEGSSSAWSLPSFTSLLIAAAAANFA